jgi:hypothetical protein
MKFIKGCFLGCNLLVGAGEAIHPPTDVAKSAT